ncbi:MAG TPA: 2-dehydropantoate 2-reductase [Burkholderiaceae bacterium]|nr:2-dehydropantoate 2-reductase [Burkholderiaceae bacterium]
MSTTESSASIAVVGAGAVGSYYGALLALAGHRVTLIGRGAHVAAIRDKGLLLHKGGTVQTVRLDASTDVAAVRGAGLVLCCVKSTDTDAVAREMAPHLVVDALVLSLQNGVDNAPALAAVLPNTVLAAAVYVATAMPGPGVVQHFGRGDLVIGAIDPGASSDPAVARGLQRVVQWMASAGLPVTVSADVRVELWRKLLVNCAYNAISALAQQPYGKMAAVPEVVQMQRALVHEVVAVAQAEGVALSLAESMEAMLRIAGAMPAQFSSTAQDMARGKRSEIDHLNGTVVRLGEKHGLAVPVNQALYALVKLVESARQPQ